MSSSRGGAKVPADAPEQGERAFLPSEPERRRAARSSLFALLGFLGLAALVPSARAAMANGTAALIPPALMAPMLTTEAVLCPLTGLAAWLVWQRFDVGLERKRAGLRRWGWLLLLSALWPAALFGARSPALACVLLLLCLAAACWTTLAFRRLQPAAALLLLPYGAWLAAMTVMATTRF